MSTGYSPYAVYLVRVGAITPDDLVTAMEVQHRRREPFGKIALKSRKLTVRQTAEILNHQANHPAQRFGEIAVQMGFMTEDDVSAILQIQKANIPTLEEVFVSEGMLTADQLDRWSQAYQQEMRRSAA